MTPLHLNGHEKRRGGGGRGGRKRAEARRMLGLTKELVADVEGRRWCLTEGLVGR